MKKVFLLISVLLSVFLSGCVVITDDPYSGYEGGGSSGGYSLSNVMIDGWESRCYWLSIDQSGTYRIAMTILGGADIDWYLYSYISGSPDDYWGVTPLCSGNYFADDSDETASVYLSSGDYCILVEEMSGYANVFDLTCTLLY